jgi:hypothetical protein
MTAPSTVGIFAWATLTLTFYQGVSEASIRQMATIVVHSPKQRAKLRAYLGWSSVSGILLLCLVIGVLYVNVDSSERSDVAVLMPIVLVPLVTAFGVIPTAELQRSEAWGQLANFRLISSAISLGLCLPILFLSNPLIACSVYPAVSELIFVLLSRHRSSKTVASAEEDVMVERSFVNELWAIASYRALGWVEGQADRVVMGTLAGTERLGFYSTGVAIARSGGDAVSLSSSNVLRARLANLPQMASQRMWQREIDRTLLPGIGVVALGVVAVWIACRTVLPGILSDDWNPVLYSAPILALATIPAFLSWNMSTILAVRGGISKMIPVRVGGILFAIPIALAAISSLEFAAWLILARDLVVAILASVIALELVPKKTVWLGSGLLLFCATLLMLESWL